MDEGIEQSGWLKALTVFFFALPVISLLIMIATWQAYGLNLPYLDDWRDYLTGSIDRLNPRHLFTPINDTMYPVGRALDALAFRWLNGNVVAYQTVSMVFALGAFIALSVALLRKGSRMPLEWAAAASFLVFALQPGSYWGEQTIAYHQILPLLAMLAILLIATTVGIHRYIRFSACAALALLGGLAYISGAFPTVALAIAMLVVAYLDPIVRRPFTFSGTGALVGGAVASAAQSWVIFVHQAGHIHVPGAAWATPLQPEFWVYALGKFGRALLLRYAPDTVGLIISIIALLAFAVVALVGLHTLRKQDSDLSVRHNARVYVPLTAGVAVYLVMVAASRAHLTPDGLGLLGQFRYAFDRFHFFWIAALLPFLMLSVSRAWLHVSVLPIIASLLVVVTIDEGAFAHKAHFEVISAQRSQTEVACIREGIAKGGPVVCPNAYPAPLTAAVIFATDRNVSFTRMLGRLETDGERVKLTSARPVNVALTAATDDSLSLAPSPDPGLALAAAWPFNPGLCGKARLTATLRTEREDRAQLYFTEPGKPLSEKMSVVLPVQAGIENKLTFDIASESGFDPALRLDPVTQPQQVTVSNLSLRCLAQR